MARPSYGPQDLDPLAAAATPISADPQLQSLTNTLALMRQDRARRAQEAMALAQSQREAGQARMEAEYEAEKAQYDENGRLKLPVDWNTPAGPGMKIDPITGRPVNMSDRELESQAREGFRADRIASAVPGSQDQAKYDPQGYAAWEQQVADNISNDAQRELAISADPSMEQQRYRRESEARVATSDGNWAIQRRRLARQAGVGAEKARELMGDVKPGADMKARQQARQGLVDLAEDAQNKRLAAQDEATRGAVIRRAQARGNPMEYLGRGDINDWQRMVAADSMLRGGAGPMTPLGVQATHNEQAIRMLERLGFGGLSPEMSPEAKAVADAKAREANPRAAGVRDIAGGNPESEQAQTELEALATQHDSGGWHTFSYDDERKLADRLQKPPYNMKKADAEEYAYRAAEKRRWFWMQGGGKAGGRSDTAPPPGADPAAWGGGAPVP